MAARRLLIVMLILLGLSTLAAALVPQHSLRDGATTRTTTTQPTTTTQTETAPAFVPPTKITVGSKKFPIVSPVPVGEQLVLLVSSPFPTQLEIPEFGQIGFAAPKAPARFELLPTAPGTFGVLFAPSGKVAAQIRVVSPGKKKKQKQKQKQKGKGKKRKG